MHRSASISMRVFLVFALILPTAFAQGPKTTKTEPKVMTIGVLGASVSAGFRSDYTLAEAVSAAIKSPHKIVDKASAMFFMTYRNSTTKLVETIEAAKPDAVLGLDYLFWFASGKKTIEQRKADIKTAIEHLDGLKCPILIGTVPAMKNVNPMMLRRDKVIPVDDVPKLNDYLRELIKDRKNIKLVPLAQWIKHLNAGTPVPGADRISEKQLKRTDVFLADGLHLNRTGLVFASAMMVLQLKDKDVLLNDKNATHKVDEILKQLAKSEASLTFKVVDANDQIVKTGLLRFDIPDFMEASRAGLTTGEIMKLSSMNKYRDPAPLSESNPFTITGIPAAANKLFVRVRAESPDGKVSAWKKVSLKPTKAKEPHVVRLTDAHSLKLRVVDADGNPRSGVKVVSRTALSDLGINRTRNLPTSFKALGTTNDNGEVTITHIGPEKQRLMLTPASGGNTTKDGFVPGPGLQTITLN